jgi:hypothetical protein
VVERSPTISFRLQAPFIAILEKQAAEFNAAHGRDKLSRNDFARKLLIETLNGPDHVGDVRDDLAKMRAEVTQLRADLATATAGLLVTINEGLPKDKRTSPDAIQAWVKSKLLG